MSKILIVDDEAEFRVSLAERLELRGYVVETAGDGDEALKRLRNDLEIEVVVLDRKMPGLDGEQVLGDIREYRPAVQVIFLTGHGSIESAMAVGKLEAFAYLDKPCDLDRLIEVIEKARVNIVHAKARHEIPHVEKGSLFKWLVGTHNSRPGVVILALILFAGIALAPPPARLVELVSMQKTGGSADSNMGYAYYSKMENGESVSSYYARSYKVGEKIAVPGGPGAYTMDPREAASRAQIMIAILMIAVLFWASGAIPIGVTALFVGAAMYFTGILRPDDVARAYAKDAVIFIFGVLALAKAISKTGLDRRIALVMLKPAKSLPRYMFLVLPIFATACSFLSEHALIAFSIPMMMMVYVASTDSAGIRKDPALAVMLVLALNFVANCGGPGSPAAGGRNAVMIGILGDYGIDLTFGEWVKYGLPFVPVMALVIATYFYFTMRGKVQTRSLDIVGIVQRANDKIGPMNRKEYTTLVVLVGLVTLWITKSDELGMGGPVIMALVLLNVFRILRWRDVATIHWEVVALYASACALGKGLAVTGGALYIADGFIGILPPAMRAGEGLAIATAVFTGIATNFMSDGATVSAIGPIAVPMSIIGDTSPLMIGLATAFASSFAHMLVIGTPNNAIVLALAKDPVTGEQLITLKDFLRHGSVVLVLCFAVLILWVILGYWRWIGF
ncbi:MAG: response regulator [bacterium]|nr:response regulator [bacterium]